MMLMAKDHFEISTNVNIDANPDSNKKLPEYFKMILARVGMRLEELDMKLDVEITDKEPRLRPFRTKFLDEEIKMIRYTWAGIGSEDDVRKWKDVWNEVEGNRGPCFFIRMNPNPLLKP